MCRRVRKPVIQKTKEHLSRTELISVRFLFLVALGIAGFLAWSPLQGGGVPGCGPESDCDKVLASRWAFIFGLPVSLFAMPVYMLALVFTVPKKIPWKLLLPITLMILVGAAWFVGLQLFVIRALCKFCMAAHVAGIVAAVLIIRRNPLLQRDRMIAGGTALALGSLLVMAQFASPAPVPRQVRLAPPGAETNRSASVQSNLANATVNAVQTNSPDPLFQIVRGQFTLDLRTVPVRGSIAAPKRMVKLFDYTCHHCRDLHHLLEPIAHRYSNQLAIVSLPMPLNANCNPMLRSTARAHIDACEYARLALAVFFVDSKKFDDFSNWLYQGERPPEVKTAKEYAGSMVGRERLEAALQDPRVGEQIRTNAFIYAASSRLGKSSALPQMIFSTGASIGAVADAQQLEKILADALGLRSPEKNQPVASLKSEL